MDEKDLTSFFKIISNIYSLNSSKNENIYPYELISLYNIFALFLHKTTFPFSNLSCEPVEIMVGAKGKTDPQTGVFGKESLKIRDSMSRLAQESVKKTMITRPGLTEKKTRESFEYERNLRDEYCLSGNI